VGIVKRQDLTPVSVLVLLAGLFAALYGLLQAEDNALMLGSLLLFALLAAAMVVTRKLDWYRIGQPQVGAVQGGNG